MVRDLLLNLPAGQIPGGLSLLSGDGHHHDLLSVGVHLVLRLAALEVLDHYHRPAKSAPPSRGNLDHKLHIQNLRDLPLSMKTTVSTT